MKEKDITQTGPVGLKGLVGLSQRLKQQQAEEAKLAKNLTIKGNVAGDIMSPALFSPQHRDINDPMAQWGQSQYDTLTSGMGSIDYLNEQRYENQSTIDAMGNSLAKMLGTAATTIASSLGNIVVGIPTAIKEGRWSGLWDNELTQALSEVEDYMEENFKIYQSKEQQNADWLSTTNLTSASFWGDDVIKNAGFMLGAAASGSAFTGGLGMMSNALGLASKANTSKVTSSILGSLFSAAGEGAIEAKQTANDIYDLKSLQINDEFERQAQQIANQFKLDENYDAFVSRMQTLSNKKEEALAQLKEDARSAGNWDLALNIPILTLGNMITLGKGFSKSFSNARALEEALNRVQNPSMINLDALGLSNKAKKLLKEGKGLDELTLDLPKAGKLRKAWELSKPILSEGSEEMNQAFASAFSGHYRTKEDVNDYWKARTDASAQQDYLGALAAIGKGFSDSWGDYNQWEQFFVGGLTGGIGIPMPTKIAKQDKTKSKFNPSRYFSWEGGSFQNLKEFNNRLQEATSATEKLNTRIKDPKFWERINSGVAHSYFQEEMDKGVANNNIKSYKDAEEKQFIQDLEAFVRAGKIEDFRQLINHSTQDLSDEDVIDIINRNTITISKEQDKQNKIDAINLQLATIESQIENEDTQSYQRIKLFNLRNELLRQREQIEGEEQKVSLYTDTHGNLKKPIEEIRKELSDNGKKLNDRINSYLESIALVNRLTGGKLNNDQEGNLAYLNYMSKSARRRAESIINKYNLGTGNIELYSEKSVKELSDLLNIEEDLITKEDDKVIIDTSMMSPNTRKELLLESEFGLNAESSIYNANRYFKEIYNKGDNTLIESYYKDITDLPSLIMSSREFNRTFNDYLNNLDKIEEDKKKAENSSNKDMADSKIDNLSTSEVVQSLDKGDLPNDLDFDFDQEELDFLSGKIKNFDDDKKQDVERKQKVQNAKSIINNREIAIEKASSLTQDQEELKAISKMLEDSSYLSETPEDLLDLDAEVFNNPNNLSLTSEEAQQIQEMFDQGISQEEIQDFINQSKQKRLDDIKNLLSQIKKEIDEGLTELKNLPQDIKDGKLQHIATMGDNSSIDPVSQPNPVNTFDTEETDSDEEYISTPDISNSGITLQASNINYTNNIEQRNYWKPNTTQYSKDRLRDENKPWYEEVRDKNKQAVYKIIYDYLNNNNAFSRINNNEVQKGDKIKFAISKQLTKDLQKQGLLSTVILLLDKDNNVIGDLVSPFDSNLFYSFTNMPDFYTKLVTYYSEHINDSTNDLVILPQESTVSRMYIGRPKFTKINNRHTLNQIADGKEFKLSLALTTGSNPSMIIEAGRRKSQGLTDEEASILSPLYAKAGQPYILVETSDPNRKYIPVSITMSTFNNSLSNTKLYNIIYNHINKLQYIIDDKQKLSEWKKEFKDLLAVGEVGVKKLDNGGMLLGIKKSKSDDKFITLGSGIFNLDDILNNLQHSNIPFQVSRKYINSIYNGLNYNELIGEIAETNLEIGALHTVNDFFSINPLQGDKEQKATKIKDIDTQNLLDQTKRKNSIDFVNNIIISNQQNIDRSKTDKDYYYIKESDGKYYSYERVHKRLPKNSNLKDNTDSPALKNGTAVDTITRDFFNNKTPVKPDNFSQEAFDNLIKQLKELKKSFDDRGYKVFANNIVLYHNYNGLRVAGEVDLLVVDNKGNFLIYDMKTSKYSFYSNSFNTIHPNWGQIMSTKDYYTAQQSSYAKLLKDQYNKDTSNIALIPFVLNYNGDNITNISKEKNIYLTPTNVNTYFISDDIFDQFDAMFDQMEVKSNKQETKSSEDVIGDNVKSISLQDKKEPSESKLSREEAIKLINDTRLFKSPNRKWILDKLTDELISEIANTNKVILKQKLEILDTKIKKSMSKEELSKVFSENLNKTLLRKTKGENTSTTITKEIARVRKILPQLSKEEAITLVNKIIDTKDGFAWGYFKNGMITLYKNAAKGTAYHEAFHYVFNTLLNDQEITNAYNEARNIWGNLDTISLEENMAEDFRQYMQNKETFFGRLKNLWKRLSNFINKLRGKESYLDSLYLNISKSKFSDRKEAKTEVSRRKELPEYSEEELKILSKVPRNSEGRLLAPNGKASNLNEKQYAQVRTKAFKEWFGDWEHNPKDSSKVVDENGEPLVVYHGSKDNTFTIFDNSKNDKSYKGFFFTDSKNMASSYGDNPRAFFINSRDSYVIEGNNKNWNDLSLSTKDISKNKLDEIRIARNSFKLAVKEKRFSQESYDFWNNKFFKLLDEYNSLDDSNIINRIKKYIILNKLNKFNSEGSIIESTRRAEKILEMDKEDVNIIFKNITDYGPIFNSSSYDGFIKNKAANVYVVTNPNNIKSATDNIGTFSTTDNDIRYRKFTTQDLNNLKKQWQEGLENSVNNKNINKSRYAINNAWGKWKSDKLREGFIVKGYYNSIKGKYIISSISYDNTMKEINDIRQYHLDKLSYKNLNEEQLQYLKDRGISLEQYNNLTLQEREILFHCM